MAHVEGMSKRRRLAVLALVPLALAAVAWRTPTSHVPVPAPLGAGCATADLEAVLDEPGPVTVETIIGADWEVARSGLINLESPEAKAAGLKDGPEPIVIAFHALRHPTQGLYLVDTGVERKMKDDPDHAVV